MGRVDTGDGLGAVVAVPVRTVSPWWVVMEMARMCRTEVMKVDPTGPRESAEEVRKEHEAGTHKSLDLEGIWGHLAACGGGRVLVLG